MGDAYTSNLCSLLARFFFRAGLLQCATVEPMRSIEKVDLTPSLDLADFAAIDHALFDWYLRAISIAS